MHRSSHPMYFFRQTNENTIKWGTREKDKKYRHFSDVNEKESMQNVRKRILRKN